MTTKAATMPRADAAAPDRLSAGDHGRSEPAVAPNVVRLNPARARLMSVAWPRDLPNSPTTTATAAMRAQALRLPTTTQARVRRRLEASAIGCTTEPALRSVTAVPR